MEKNCKACKNFFECDLTRFLPFPEAGCSDFQFAANSDYVLIHRYLDSGFDSIVCFGDDIDDLRYVMHSQVNYGKLRHLYIISENVGNYVEEVKDKNLINICRNVASYLATAEYAMLKKSYFKSKSWFDKAKNSASLASLIIQNY